MAGGVAVALIVALVLVLSHRGTSQTVSPGIDPILDPSGGTNFLVCPDDHPIWGNVTTRTKIYYVSGDADYQKKRPERCFTNTASAEAENFAKP